MKKQEKEKPIDTLKKFFLFLEKYRMFFICSVEIAWPDLFAFVKVTFLLNS